MRFLQELYVYSSYECIVLPGCIFLELIKKNKKIGQKLRTIK